MKDEAVRDLIFTEVKKEEAFKYYLGLSGDNFHGVEAFGHGGFWGTVVFYLPELNTSIAVFVLERDKRILRKNIMESFIKELLHLQK